VDSNHDCGVTTPAPTVEARLAEALNEQVLPQLAHLAHGPLAIAALNTLRGALEHKQAVAGTALQLRVMLDGRLFDLAVQVLVTPPPEAE